MEENKIQIQRIQDVTTTRVIVVGAGHAGVEAALASARLGVYFY